VLSVNSRVLSFLCFSQFAVNLSFGFINAFLPFYLHNISPYIPQHTLLWIGVIMGATGMCLAVSAPFWGSLTHRISPRPLYLFGLIMYVVTFALMAFTANLPLFLLLRVMQGIFGGTATIGLIIISSSPDERRVQHIGIFQSSITLGILAGPLFGAATVNGLGYRPSFLIAAAILFAAVVLCCYYLPRMFPLQKTVREKGKRSFHRGLFAAWFLCAVAQVQLSFLPSIFPNVFHEFGIDRAVGLRYAGLLIALFTGTALMGTYLWSLLGPRIGIRRLVTFLVLSAAALQALLIFSGGIKVFSAFYMVETFLAAAVAPLTLSLFAGKTGGGAIGFLYASRFVGGSMASIMAASMVAFFNIPFLFISISSLSLAALFLFWSSEGDVAEPRR
jgi:MFS transporter, DHA1 family, multidrug resistance protein